MDDQSKKLKKAKEAVFRYLKIRLRSEAELREKLARKKYDPQTVQQTIDYFKQYKYIDDRQFAQAWISSRLAKPFGLARIRFELRTKGVKNSIIEDAIKNVCANYAEEKTVTELVERRQKKYEGLEPAKIRQRLYGYLSRRGFNLNDINRALNTQTYDE